MVLDGRIYSVYNNFSWTQFHWNEIIKFIISITVDTSNNIIIFLFRR